MQLRRLTVACLGLAALAAFAPPAFAQPAAAPGVTDTEIKIGVHLSLSGPASFVGQGARVGVALAVAEINGHGGVNGRKLSVITQYEGERFCRRIYPRSVRTDRL